MTEFKIELNTASELADLFGAYDANVTAIEKALNVSIRGSRDDGCFVVITSSDKVAAENAHNVLSYLVKIMSMGEVIDDRKVEYALSMVSEGCREELNRLDDSLICISAKGKPIKAKTVGQKEYVELIRKNTIVLGAGPAGTGKTFLAVAMAVSALRNKEVSRIILTRPAVEAGERLGYLPGDLQSKVDPYLRPLYDSLFETMGAEAFNRNMEKGVIEIAPLAYMRGRTLDDSFIILDEAQNTTHEQMKMFLTRLGFNSKAVVTGDLTQTDLPKGVRSGLADATKILDGIEGIAIHKFTQKDVVRHKLVQKIIMAYENHQSDSKKEG